jgi:hypothetical protein
MENDNTAGKVLLRGKHCRGPGCDDYNESIPFCGCPCYACGPNDLKPTPEQRVKNRTLARAIIRKYNLGARIMSDDALNADPASEWLEGIILAIKRGIYD